MKIRFCTLLIGISFYLNPFFAVPRSPISLVDATDVQYLTSSKYFCFRPNSSKWSPEALETDPKPKSSVKRIYSVGELVLHKSCVQRVVWNGLKPDHHGSICIRRKSAGQIPILPVSRSLEEGQLSSELDRSRTNEIISIKSEENASLNANMSVAEGEVNAETTSSNISGATTLRLISVYKTSFNKKEEGQLNSELGSSRKKETNSIKSEENANLNAKRGDTEVEARGISSSPNINVTGAKNPNLIPVYKNLLSSLNNKEKKQQPLEGEVDQGKVSKINLLSPVAAKTQLNTSSMNNMSLSNNVSFINRNNSEAKKCCALQVYKTINLLPLLRFKDEAPKVEIVAISEEYVINEKLKVLPKSTGIEMQLAEDSYEVLESIKELLESVELATNEMKNNLYYWFLKHNLIMSEILGFAVSFLATTAVFKIFNFLRKTMARKI